MNRICAAEARAFFSSRWPMYWLATTAPPVASALMIWIIRVLNVSTRLTPETAASPTEETIRVSARPMVTLSACSAMRGSSRAVSCLRVNSGWELNFVDVMVPPMCPLSLASLDRHPPFVAYATSPSGRRESFPKG